eukprot:scaffold91044_cov59-Attheya_sp.AAC.1
MDTTEREEVVRHRELVVRSLQYARSSLESRIGDVVTLLQLAAVYENKLENFIPEAADSTERINKWRQ